MEPTAIPLNLTLKVEESEEQIQSPELEDGSADMQKVRICSEGAWVSQGRGPHGCAKPPPRADRGRKNSPAQPSPVQVFAFPRKQCCGFKRCCGNGAGYLSRPFCPGGPGPGSPHPWVPHPAQCRHVVDTLFADLCHRNACSDSRHHGRRGQPRLLRKGSQGHSSGHDLAHTKYSKEEWGLQRGGSVDEKHLGPGLLAEGRSG